MLERAHLLRIAGEALRTGLLGLPEVEEGALGVGAGGTELARDVVLLGVRVVAVGARAPGAELARDLGMDVAALVPERTRREVPKRDIRDREEE